MDGEGNGNPLQYSCLENPVYRGAWWAAVYGVTQSWSDLAAAAAAFIMEESVLQCRRPGFNPWFGKIPWRREWLFSPQFLLGESHGQRSLAGYSSWDPKELDMTKQQTHSFGVHFSRSVMSNSLWPHESQHARPLGLYAAKGFPLNRTFYNILWSHTLTFTETQQAAEGNKERRWKEIRNRGRKEKKIRKEILNYWEERANQIWREDTRQISRDQSLEPTICTVPRSIVQETCWLFIYSLSALICLPF